MWFIIQVYEVLFVKMINILSKGTIRQYLVGFSSTLSTVILGTMTAWSFPVIRILKSNETQVAISDTEIARMVSLLHLGNVLSPIPAGYLMDYIGRKATVLYLTIIPLSSWLILLFATKPNHLYIGRFLGGIYYGISQTVVPIYLAEISEVKSRCSVTNFPSLMIYAGALFVYVIGPYVNYQTLNYSCLAITIIFVPLFVWVPESPYYLLMRNKNDCALKSLTWLRSGKTSSEIMKEFISIDAVTKQDMKVSGRFKDLIARSNRKALIIVTVLAVTQRLTGITALIAYSSITIPEDAFPGLSLESSVTILGLVWFLGGCLSVLLINKVGHKVLLNTSTCGCVVTSLTISTWFYLHQKTSIDVSHLKGALYIILLSHAVFYSLGIGPIGCNIKSELFPCNVKAKASAISTIILAGMAFSVNRTYIIIADLYGMCFNYLIYGISSTLAMIFSVNYFIETKGRTFTEIQDDLHS